MLNSIKLRCGIAPAITAYDGELECHIEAAVEDMRASGVPKRLAYTASNDPRVINAVALYVRSQREKEPNTMARYKKLFQEAVFRLTLEDENV